MSAREAHSLLESSSAAQVEIPLAVGGGSVPVVLPGVANVAGNPPGARQGWGCGTVSSWFFLNTLLFFFAGGRDKRGGPILTFPARSNHDRIRQEDLRKLVTYLASVPR